MTGTFEGVGSLQFSPDNKFCYAYSGLIQAGTGAVSQLLFETNSEYIKGTITVIGNIKIAAPADGGTSIYQISFNDVEVLRLKCDAKEEDMPSTITAPIFIPPFTEVTVTALSEYGSADYLTSASLVGEVHGAIEQENLEAITNNNKWASL